MSDAVTRWTPATVVTMLRIVLVPAFAVVFLADGGASSSTTWTAAIIFLIAALSDKVDGYLARSRGQVTDLGKILDPVADKFLMISALVLLSISDIVPWWITIVIIVRELGITLFRLAVAKRQVIPASAGGKLKTVLQTAAIGLYLMPLSQLPGWVTNAADITLWAALLVTVVTGFDYLLKWYRSRQAVAVRQQEAS